MQISKQRVNPTLEKQISRMWYQLIADTRSPDEAEKIFSQILSETETAAITKRLAVGYWLSKSRSYENIKNNLKVSSATIATIQQNLKHPGWKLALQKAMAEEWATQWERKIKGLLKRKQTFHLGR
jgi:uncharacterized protein YerC